METYLAQELSVQRIVAHFKDSMFYDLMSAGVLTNELLHEYSEMVNAQMRAFHLLNRNYLPTDIMNPNDLKKILARLVEVLTVKYPFLRLENER